MSGICGIAFRDKDRHVNSADLWPMVRALEVSRQGEGWAASLGRVGVGAQKVPGHLAGVVKLALQERPVILALHASLYNLEELVASKERSTDPLVGLLDLYLKEGMTFLQRLRGEFVLAVWDELKETLYLATDRFRVHPALYYHDQDKLVFASRMKGILGCPFSIKRTINLEAVVDVVASSFIPTPKTIFQEVKKLPPGHILTYHKGEITLERYWQISFLRPDCLGKAAMARNLKACFADAISVRLQRDGISDRIGTFLSGGVDSTTVTGVLTRLAERPIKSFSIGFGEQRFNEINYARIAARALGVDHYEYFVTPQDTYDAIPELVESFDEPFANASAVPTYFCARLAREHGVEVLYAGDGGDELFAGNQRYATQRLFEYYHTIPPWLRQSLVEPVVFGLADRLGWKLLIKAEKYIQRASIPYPQRLTSYGLFELVPMAELFEQDLLELVGMEYDPYDPVYLHYHEAQAESELDRQLYVDLKLAISDNDLFKVTRMAEAAGVTVRFPFLDHVFAECAASVPASIKMRGRTLRSFFKSAYADLLPPETLTKKKHGFGLPIPVWLRTDRQLNELLHDLVLGSRCTQRGYFRKKALEELVDRHKTDDTSFYGTVLWNLMVLELWHRANL